MKSNKVLPFIVGAFGLALPLGIAFLPTASFAENVNGNSQSATLESTTIGNGNVSVTETQQKMIDLQKSGKEATNISGTAQNIKAITTTVGNGNIDVKQVVQEALNGQKSK